MRKALFVFLFVMMIGLSSAIFYIGNNNYGDDFEDGSLNSTFWQNWTGISGDTATFQEITGSDGYLNLHTSAVDDGSDSHAIAQLNLTKNLYGYGNMVINMSLNLTTRITGPAGNTQTITQIRINDDGTYRNLYSKTCVAVCASPYNIDKENWWIYVNATSNLITLYNETGTVGSQIMTSQNWILNFYSIAEEPVAGGGSGGSNTADINLFNITIISEKPLVNLTSPLNNSLIANPIYQATITKGANNLQNATLFVWNSTNSIINQTTKTISGNVNLTTFSIVNPPSKGVYRWNIESCDINGICSNGGANKSFTYGFQLNSETYNATTYETLTESFIANITIPSGSTISIANFYYNNTQYNVAPTLVSGNDYILSKSLAVPGVTAETIKSFHWEVIFTDGFNQNTSQQNQTIIKYPGINVAGTCGAGFVPSITFNLKDENLTTTVSSNIEYNVKYGFTDNDTDLVVFGNLTSVSTFSICINNSLPYVVTGDSVVKYGGSPYVERDFFVFNGVRLTNVTTNHTLYNLASTLSTSFLVTVEDNTLTPYEDVYVGMLRWYPELDQYNIVEMGRTDEKGQTVLRVITEDIDYRFAVYNKNGSLLKLTEPLRMVCLVNPCELSIKIDESTNFISFLEVESSLAFNNNTGIFTFTWNDPNQFTTLMNLSVYKITSTSTIPICESTATGFTGVITCDVSSYTGTLKAVVERSASPPIIIETLIAEIRETLVSVGGGDLGLFMSFILIIFVALASIINPILGIVGAVIALVPAMIFGGLTKTILILIAMMGVIVIVMMGRANR